MISSSQRPLPNNTQHSRQTSMPPEGFEPTSSAGLRSQIHSLDSATTGIVTRWNLTNLKYNFHSRSLNKYNTKLHLLSYMNSDFMFQLNSTLSSHLQIFFSSKYTEHNACNISHSPYNHDILQHHLMKPTFCALYNAYYISKKLKLRLTLILLTWRIWRAPNNASKWQMGFNWVFKWLKKYNH